MAPTSSFRMSPSRMRRLAGIPWTTSSLSDVQMEAGNPRYPLNDGVAHRLLPVVFPLGQPAPTAVADVLLAWRRQLDVVGTLADGAAAPSRDSLHGQLILHGQEQSRRDGEPVLDRVGFQPLGLANRP